MPGICGCGFADIDSDGDGTMDCLDACPNDPDKVGQGVCGCGIPDVDSDADGTMDCVDACPADPNKVEPGICDCGIPDIDTDGDDTMDCLDACPADPNKINPGICGCGVADSDSDGDGVVDCVDNCIDTYNPDQADSDGNGVGDACETIVDTTPPVLGLTVSPDSLWPPNHKMVSIIVTKTVSDNRDPDPFVELLSITMNESEETNTYEPSYDQTVGDGHTLNDIFVDTEGNIFLRAERSGTGDGRVYSIIYQATDFSGNSATATANVIVPHSQ